MDKEEKTVAIFLDVEKAFNKVCNTHLIFKLITTGVNKNVITIITSYLSGRTFQIIINDEKSTTRHAKAGVLQGSILGSTLYNLYTVDLPNFYHSKIALYADDTALYTKSININLALKHLQQDLNILINWMKKCTIRINTNKIEAIIFSRSRKTPNKNLKIDEHDIEYKKHVKYLGIKLNKKLTYRHQTVMTKIKTKQLAGTFYLLINHRSKLSLDNKFKIHKAIIRPTLTYGLELLHDTKKTNIKKSRRNTNKNIKNYQCTSIREKQHNTQRRQNQHNNKRNNTKKVIC